MFLDRMDAGRRLGETLARRGHRDVVVLAIPRGGVPVAAEVARALDAELGVVVARKVGAPRSPELAIGAVTADGTAVIDRRLAGLVGASEAWIREECARQVDEARRREAAFDGQRGPELGGRDVIVVDDGLATGATARAAIRSVTAAGAASVTFACPVGWPRALDELRSEVDDVVCLVREPRFRAVGAYYQDFRQVGDGEVKAILDTFRAPATNGN